ncbi:NUDIX hydrolase [Anaerorhabdus sp.]|uniref:NUDIX hydrolase n=1 Tax=Anaerorhabdus sp. TaxID=1872524 RepID=UPI002B215CBB|nr:8-oxo-dGTP diphosphatase [Anaerorhabdus sp.]MEA4875222.1 8-oxo-dGTP diphosphatase [Anaerorhabdus sp.]
MLTTLCYIEKDNQFLMMHRTKKQNDPNAGKWIGLGGKFKDYESPEECVLREVKEETGLNLIQLSFRGIITFTNNDNWTEYMFLFTSTEFSGTLDFDCNEGELAWINKDEVTQLNLWEGDKYFLEKLVTDDSFFTMKLSYNGDKLIEAIYNNEKIH